jgi:hypothetical protein
MQWTRWLPVALLLGFATTICAQPARDEDDAASRKRLAFMEQAIGSFTTSSDQIKDAAHLKIVSKPILRYSDPTRGTTAENVLVDATVWRLGETGRPTGLVTLEIYRTTAEAGILAYEFASLSEARFSLVHKRNRAIAWDATGSALTRKPLEGGTVPAKTAPGRLTQMRQLARRFTVHETLNDQVIECRLLAQPIDRYQSEKDEIEDGAIFAFANGTNPEIGLTLECGKDGWIYGTVRLSAADVTVKLDGREVARYAKINSAKRQGDYTSTIERIELPK